MSHDTTICTYFCYTICSIAKAWGRKENITWQCDNRCQNNLQKYELAHDKPRTEVTLSPTSPKNA